jgi:hypothetical protein
MKKVEMENEYLAYKKCLETVKEYERQGLYAEALKNAYTSLEHINGMIQYKKKKKEKSQKENVVLTSEINDSADCYSNSIKIESIHFILKYAPLLFDFEGLNTLEKVVKTNKRIEKNVNISIVDISEAKARLRQAHMLWNHIEHNPQTHQDRLSKVLGGKQNQWNSIVETWEKIGLLLRHNDGNTYRLDLRTRMGSLTRGKCSQCGSVQEAPKGMFLEPTVCPDCRAKVYFVILSV